MFLWPPLGHTGSKIKAIMRRFGEELEAPGGIGVKLTQGKSELVDLFHTELSPQELLDTRCLVKKDSAELSVSDMAQMSTLKQALAYLDSDDLIAVIRDGRMKTMFQPIVHAKQTHVPFAHECLLRIVNKDGGFGSPARAFEMAKEADLLFPLDRAAREFHIRSAAAQQAQTKFFINFTPTAIYDPKNCLRTTFNVIRDLNITPDQIVFEVIETEKVMEPRQLLNILRYYQYNGFGVALDDLGAGHSTLQLLGELKPDYVKLDMELVRNVHKDSYKAELVKHIINLSHTFGIQVIGEGVEELEEASFLISQEVDYMQGYYYAKPADTSVATVERRGE